MHLDEVEFPCPACGTVNRIAEALVPANGEIRCGHCGETVSLRPATRGLPSPYPASAPHDAGCGSNLPNPALTTDTLILSNDGNPGPVPPPMEQRNICCPACGHNFDSSSVTPQRPTILIVEDTDFFLQLAVDVLGQEFHTIAARTVAEARKVLATSPVHLVVLDLTLPDAEGTEVLRALPRRDIPVLIYTSRDETSLIGPEWQALTSLGANDVIHKGLNIEETLYQKAQDLLAARPV